MHKPGPKCHECPLKDAPGPVWGEGSTHSPLAIIGQNPGRTEIEECRPFEGGSGNILNSGLARAGIQRYRSFVTNAVKCFVAPGQELPDKAIECCQPLLELELNTLTQAQTYLTLGAPAFQVFTNKRLSTTTNKKDPNAWMVGYPYPVGKYKVIIPTYHPSYLARTGFKDTLFFDLDLQKVKRFMEGKVKILDEKYNYKPTSQETREYVEEIIGKGQAGLDIETPMDVIDEEERIGTSAVTTIDVIGLSANLGEAIGVPPDLYPLLAPLFEHPDQRVILFTFNAGFDLYHIAKRWRLTGIRSFDLMLAMHMLYSDLRPKDLGMAGRIFTDIPYWKNLMRTQPDLYNARDTYGALWGGINAWNQLRELGQDTLFWERTMPLVPIVEDIRVTGIRTDVDKANRIMLQLHKELTMYDKAWSDMLPTVDWASPKQLLELFVGRQKLPPVLIRRPNGFKTPTVNDDALELYATKHGSKIAGLVQHMRTLRKSMDFFAMHSPDGRMHPTIKIHGQAGHRLQAKEPNVMQIPEKMGEKDQAVYPREIVLPDDDDSVVIVADFSQIEFFLYAKQANCADILKTWKNGDYAYGPIYEMIFKEPFFQEGQARKKAFIREDVEPWKLLVTKSFPLGYIYGRSEKGMTTPKVNAMKAKEIYGVMDRNWPEIHLFHDRILAQAERNRYLTTPFGHMRRFPNPKGSLNEILAFPGQTTAFGVLQQNALIPFADPERGLRQFDARMMFTVHDSVIVSAKKRNADVVADFIKHTMEAPIPQMDNFWIPVDIKIGVNWGQVKRHAA